MTTLKYMRISIKCVFVILENMVAFFMNNIYLILFIYAIISIICFWYIENEIRRSLRDIVMRVSIERVTLNFNLVHPSLIQMDAKHC